MKRAIKISLLLLTLASCGKGGLLGQKSAYTCVDSVGNDTGEVKWMTEKQVKEYQEKNNCSCYAQ